MDSTFSSTEQRAVLSAVIKQAYSDNPSVGNVALEALTYALIERIRQDNPSVADALDAASLARCLAR